MQLRRTAATLTGLGLTLALGAAPAAAHEGHEEEGRPGQNKDVFPLHCEGVGDLTVEVTSAGEKGRGVGRIIEGGKGVLIPTLATFEVRKETGEVLESEVEEFSPGQRDKGTTTCTAEFFRGTVGEVAQFDPDFADFLLGAGASQGDVIVAELSVEVLLRGPMAKSGR